MLEKLTPRHKTIIRRLILGQTPSEIASDLGMSPQTIRSLQNDPVFQTEMADTEFMIKKRLADQVDLLQHMEIFAEDAAQLIGQTINDNDVAPLHLRIKCAFDVLDRTGFYKPKHAAEGRTPINPAELIIKAYLEKRGKAKQITDVEVIDK